MPSKRPPGSYSSKLVDEIRDYHARFISPGNRRRSKNSNPELAPITNEMLADCASIGKTQWSKSLNKKAYLNKEDLFRLISMPWVTPDAAQRWIFLWMANELDAFEIEPQDDAIHFREAMKSRSWTPTRNLDRLADSLDLLSNYVPTLGVIDQIDHARRRQNSKIVAPEWRLPELGPSIAREDPEGVLVNKSAKYVRAYREKLPLNKLAKQFAEDLASREAEEHAEYLIGVLNDEAEEIKIAETGHASELESLADRSANVGYEELREIVISELGLDVADHVYAAAAADLIIAFAKGCPDDA